MINGDAGYTCSTVPPPPPPSASDAWAASEAEFPYPAIQVSPQNYGLTQLQTWFWLNNNEAGGDVSATAQAYGYTVTVTVQPEQYHWYFGDGDEYTSETAGGPGGAAEASAKYTYVDAGDYEVGLIIGYSGSYTVNGGPPIALTVPGEYVDGPEAFFPYEVQQAKSVLVGGG